MNNTNSGKEYSKHGRATLFSFYVTPSLSVRGLVCMAVSWEHLCPHLHVFVIDTASWELQAHNSPG